MILAEQVGPYTIGLAVVMLGGFPIAARYVKKAVTVQGFGMRAEIGAVKEDIKVAADAAKTVAESIGNVNGEGSLQEQVTTMTTWMSEESAKREEGQHRQVQMSEAIINLQNMIATMRNMLDSHAAWQLAHGEEDMRLFQNLQQSCEHLKELLGERLEGMTDEPLIPYVHRLKHDLANVATKERMLIELQHKTLVDAIEAISDIRAELKNRDSENDTDGES